MSYFIWDENICLLFGGVPCIEVSGNGGFTVADYEISRSRTHIRMIISWKAFAKVEPCHEINSVIVIEITRRRNP